MKNADWQNDDWSIWRDRKRWPFAPQAYVYLADAAEQLCKAWWGDGWLTPFHFDCSLAAPPSADQIIAQRDDAVEQLHKFFAEGEVQTAYKNLGTLEFSAIRERAWYCERPVAERRIRSCTVDAANLIETNPFVRRVPLLCPVFVTRQSLDTALDAITAKWRPDIAIDAGSIAIEELRDESRALVSSQTLISGAWVTRRASAKQRSVFKFFNLAPQHMPDGSRPLSKTELRAKYSVWAEGQPGKEPTALARTAFEEMFDRHQDGWRLDSSGRWTHS
ncbi:hypothetical protein [Sphingobium yanoikuyae]|uniref:hypothetical protein n=1 Tax=Sphingobium yanoikuyae TaxID=13690 RepID=UPI000496A7C9|nr:hypothetical protein [Sphingobium yanoikuyae]